MTEYVVGIDDLFVVEADSEEEAEEKLLAKIGADPFKPYNAKVIEEFEGD